MGVELVHRAYSFVCLHCGHGWEAEYDIHLITDQYNRLRADYYAAGQRVPSPLARGQCPDCESRALRILRPGRVDSARPSHD